MTRRSRSYSLSFSPAVMWSRAMWPGKRADVLYHCHCLLSQRCTRSLCRNMSLTWSPCVSWSTRRMTQIAPVTCQTPSGSLCCLLPALLRNSISVRKSSAPWTCTPIYQALEHQKQRVTATATRTFCLHPLTPGA